MTEVQSTPLEAPSKRLMSFTILGDGSITASFGEGIEPLSLPLEDVPEALKTAAISEGLVSRLRGYTSKLTEGERTAEALRDAIAKGMENLRAGIWKTERAASGLTEFTIDVSAAWEFRKTRAEAKGETFIETLAETAVAWEALTDDQRKAVKAIPRFQAIAARIKAERQTAKAAALAAKATASEEASPF